jgi:hypothetical protein
MKSNLSVALMVICLQVAFIQASFAQKTIKIDAQLKAKSQPMTVKRKGLVNVGRYEFGIYKVISGKTGGQTTRTRSPFFGDNTSINSSENKSFVFINGTADTTIANIHITENIKTYDGNWFSRTFLNWNDSQIEKGQGIFETAFEFSADTTSWKLAVIYPLAIEQNGNIYLDNNTKFKGVLTDTKTFIEIKEVSVNEDGKKAMLSPVLGYEFWLDSKSVAAVQVSPIHKSIVWISDDLDNRLKFILASGAVALLIKTF